MSGGLTDVPESKLHELIALAREPSSARRRELLREITNLFFAAHAPAAAEMALYDDLMIQLAGEMEEAVRAELSERMADALNAPRKLLRKLSHDKIAVASPVLTRSQALSEEDLLQVARTRDQDHLRAISQRASVSEAVSDVIVGRGDDTTLSVLLSNDNATLSRIAHEVAVDRALANSALHRVVVDRQSLPTDLLNEMYFVVEARLRERILKKNSVMNPAAVEAALAVGRKRIAERDGALPPDFAEAEAEVRRLRDRAAIGPETLAAFLRGNQTTKFLIALAELADLDFHTARLIHERRELDALAIVCKAADFDRALFLTFAVLILGREGEAMGKAKQYSLLYSELPRDTACRTVRFWRMRRQEGDMAA
jgi:uncharacterized protein (DUF2336 family)